jgi:AraC-like DNA-binding protein
VSLDATDDPCGTLVRAPIDPISATLMELSLVDVVCVRSELTAPWALDVPVAPGQLMFHIPVKGSCLLLAEGETHEMGPGHFALVTEPGTHVLCSEPGVEGVDAYAIPTEVVAERMEVLTYGGGGEPTTLVCGVASLSHPLAHLVLDALPDILHTHAEDFASRELASSALHAFSREATRVSVGGAALISLLSNLLVIEAVRAWLDARDDDLLPRWFAALRHPQIGRVLAAIHQEPASDWTVDRMAGVAFMSKSSFHEAFRRVVGMTPLRYVLHLRMRFAASLLTSGELSVSEVAHRCGYDSESSFTRAFRRELGQTPSAVRARRTPLRGA